MIMIMMAKMVNNHRLYNILLRDYQHRYLNPLYFNPYNNDGDDADAYNDDDD